MSILRVTRIRTGDEGNGLVEDEDLTNGSDDEDVDVKSNNFALRNILSTINVLLIHAELVHTDRNLEHIHERDPDGLELLKRDTKVDMSNDRKHEDDEHVQLREVVEVSLKLRKDFL